MNNKIVEMSIDEIAEVDGGVLISCALGTAAVITVTIIALDEAGVI